MTAALPPGLDRPKPGVIRARFRTANGKQRSKQWPEHGNMREAKRWLAAGQSAVENGAYIEPCKMTVMAYAEQALGQRRKIKPRTRTMYGSYHRHLGGLGAIRLDKVKPADVEDWVSILTETLSPRTTRSVVGYFKGLFGRAVKRGEILRSPFIEIDLPEVTTERVPALTVDQVEAIAAGMPERYRVGVILQAALGLRVSELLALNVADVAFLSTPCMVRIERQLDRNGRDFVTLKTKDSERSIPLAEPVKERLSEHMRAYRPNIEGVILTTMHHNPVTQKVYGENWRRAVRAAVGVPDDTSPHALRHHAASLLVASGVPVTAVAEFLGHKDASMIVKVYKHLAPDADQVIARTLATVWRPNVSQAVSPTGSERA